jgi:hypothetical protein
MSNIKFNRATASLMAGMTLPEFPDSDEIHSLLYKTALLDESEADCEVLKGLLDAYVALLGAEDGGDALELVHDGHGKDKSWDAEKIYMKYVMAGFRYKLPDFKKASDGETYESCSVYYFAPMSWPVAFLAEVAFARGVRDALEAKALGEYMRAQQVAG